MGSAKVPESPIVSPIDRDLQSAINGTGDFFDGKRILVTGGAGFIGSWLCNAIVRSNADVVCLDNLSTGSRSNISSLSGESRFSFVKKDISRSIPNEEFDVIVHGASIPAPDLYMKSPIETIRSNSFGIHKVLEQARRSDSIVLFLSTSEIYGDAKQIPTPETYPGMVDTLGPRACYYESKRYGETLCMSYLRQYSMDIRIARLFNSYGPRLDVGSGYSRVISRFIVQCLKGSDITVHGDGRQTRSFCYASDTIRALLLMIREDTKGETINIGSEDEMSIVELAHLVRKMTGSQSRVIHEDSRPDDPHRRHPDIRKARELLKWSPRVGLRTGLSKTVEWFKAELKDAPSTPGS